MTSAVTTSSVVLGRVRSHLLRRQLTAPTNQTFFLMFGDSNSWLFCYTLLI